VGRARLLSAIAAPLDQCAELLGVDLATIREVAASVEHYIRVDGTKVWSLMRLSSIYAPRRSAGAGRLHDRRRTPTADT
jgi:hypothetical protein